MFFFFFQAEDGIRDGHVTGVQTCALPIFTLDLLGMYGDAIALAIKERVQAVTGIPGERVLLNCSHTHYGPVMGGATEGREGANAPEAIAYHATLPHLIAGVVAMAEAARRP